jgi:hypothetical protein
MAAQQLRLREVSEKIGAARGNRKDLRSSSSVYSARERQDLAFAVGIFFEVEWTLLTIVDSSKKTLKRFQ